MNHVEVALTWTLLHSLWVAFIIWMVVGGLAVFFKRSQHLRLLKIGGIGLFSLTMLGIMGYQLLPASVGAGTDMALVQESIELTAINVIAHKIDSSVSLGSEIIPKLWLIGLIYGLFRLLISRKSMLQYRKTALPCFDEKVNNTLSGFRLQLSLKRKVTLLISPLINSPMTTGVLKPVIYLPAGLISGFSSDELDAILMHELMHIKRYDYLVNLLLVSLETLFFFNPVLLLLIKDLRKEMEFACDDSVIQNLDKVSYAKVLYRLQVINVESKLALAAKRGGEFKSRIERIVKPEGKSPNQLFGLAPLLLLCVFLLASAFGFKNTEDKIPVAATLELKELLVAQDTIPDRPKQDTLVLKWPEGKDTLVHNGSTLVWNGKGERPKTIKLRGELPKGETIVVTTVISQALKTADKMMAEIHEELMKDGIINEDRKRIILMFQYSDILNGESTLGEYYQKYKDIFNRYFPKYDSFATTRAFSYKSDQ